MATRAGWSLIDLARAFLNGGARFLQIRAKQASSGWLLDTSSAVVTLARGTGAVVVVNDRADLARLSHADGVHLGQEDLAPAAARAIVGRDALVGLSTHSFEQVDAAGSQPVSYLAIGPVFGTATKATGHAAIGLDLVGRVAMRARERGLPLVAIGGITLDTAADVIRAGASSVDPRSRGARPRLSRAAVAGERCIIAPAGPLPAAPEPIHEEPIIRDQVARPAA